MASPSAAVTIKLSVFSPTTRLVSPESSYEASGSVVSTKTSTSNVFGSRSMTDPSTTFVPFTWNVASEASKLNATERVT